MSRVTLAASWVLPMDGPPLRDGRVVCEGDRVSWVGGAGDPGAPEAPVRDLGSGVLLPGLVNAHCHLELSHLAGQIPRGEGFVPWVEAVVAARERAEPGATEAWVDAIRSLEDHGTVAVGDVSNTLGPLGLLGASRLRAIVFLELLAWDPARAEATVAWADEQLAAAARTPAPGAEVRVAAHAPHSVSPELLALLVERGGVGSLHLAESPEESRFLSEGDGPWAEFLVRRGLGHVSFRPPGQSPVEYADRLGVLGPTLVAAHGVQVDDADRQRLAGRGVAVALCPRSNRNIGVGRADVPGLLDAGVRVCLGTDSLASVDSLDVLEDAVALAREFPDLDRAAIVRMATAGGAEALGLDDLGTIAPGKRAALAFAPAQSIPSDPYAHLLCGSTRLRPAKIG